MSKSVVSCQPGTNLAAAASLMWGNDCGILPVVDSKGRVIGVITDRDISIAVGTRDRPAAQILVSEVATRRSFTCKAKDDVRTALKTMRSKKVRRLPVVNGDGGLEGVLSLDDLVLHARNRDGTTRPEISYEDVVNTFRTICEHGADFGSHHLLAA
jgi:CBS domain-containing protein